MICKTFIVGAVAGLCAAHFAVAAPASSHKRSRPAAHVQHWNWPSALLFARVVGGDRAADQATLDILPQSENITARVPIASLTKNMTAYLVMEALEKGQLKPDQQIPIDPVHLQLPSNRFATAVLPKGLKTIAVSEALTLLLRQSNNTMGDVLADAVAGDGESFTHLMNVRAQQWGMDDTKFRNPHGLPEGDRKGEYSTAKDLALMGKHLLRYRDEFKAYSFSPLTVAGRQVVEHKVEAKTFLRSVGVVFKTATIDGCRSLMAFFEVGDETYLALNLCSSKDRYNPVVNFVKEQRKKFTDAAEAKQPDDSIQFARRDPS